MTDRPLIMSAPMVRALLAGIKTQSRRTLKDQPGDLDKPFMMDDGSWHTVSHRGTDMTPIGVRFRVGDRLWVREAFSGPHEYDAEKWPPGAWFTCDPIWFWADGNPSEGDWTRPKPAIHMPRWASRFTLTVNNVRVERLQDISEEDALAEGAPNFAAFCEHFSPGKRNETGETAAETASRLRWAQRWYQLIWNDLHGLASWDANLYVAALTFSVEHRNIDADRRDLIDA